MDKLTFPSMTSMYKWTGHTNISFLDNDDGLPYVYKDGQYWYFVLHGKDYDLMMTSTRDLGEQK